MKLWRGRTCLHTFTGHSGSRLHYEIITNLIIPSFLIIFPLIDTVRGLALMPGIGVLSASHDWLVIYLFIPLNGK